MRRCQYQPILLFCIPPNPPSVLQDRTQVFHTVMPGVTVIEHLLADSALEWCHVLESTCSIPPGLGS